MRGVNRFAAALLGLVLLVVGLAAAAELALIASGHPAWPSWLADWLSRWPSTTVGDPGVRALAIGGAVLGVLILLTQLRHWRPDRVPAGDADQGVWWLSRRAVERRARARVGSMVGVHAAQADVRGGARHWRVRVSAEAKPDQREPMEQAVRGELHRLDLPDGVPLELALRPPRRVS